MLVGTGIIRVSKVKLLLFRAQIAKLQPDHQPKGFRKSIENPDAVISSQHAPRESDAFFPPMHQSQANFILSPDKT